MEEPQAVQIYLSFCEKSGWTTWYAGWECEAVKKCMTHKLGTAHYFASFTDSTTYFKKGKSYTSGWKIVYPLAEKMGALFLSRKWSNSSGSSIYSHKLRQKNIYITKI